MRSLTPFVHVADVRRSIGWYEALGMQLVRTWSPEQGDELEWAALGVDGARIMLQRASAPVEAHVQSVLFYAHVEDLDAFRRLLEAKGIEPGPITDGSPGPSRELRLTDPDGYVVMVAQIEPDPVA